MCQGYTPRVPTKYSIFRKNTTQAHQNEKICQQSTFLTFIIYSSLALSLPFVLFLTHSIIFRPFWWVVSLPLFGKTRNIIPPKETHPAAFSPAYTRQVRDFPSRKRLFLSLSLVQSVVCPFLVFSGRYIYFIYSSSSLVVWRSKRARGKNQLIGETIRFFRYSFRARFSSVKRFDWRS